MRLLFVCTANRSRSPVAAALWQRELGRRGLTAHVESAGVLARDGEPIVPSMAWAAVLHGIRLADHRSRALDAGMAARADLILTMTREQADQVGMTHPRVGDRLFLLGELAALLRMDVGMPLDPGTPRAAISTSWTAAPALATTTLATTDRLAATLATARARRILRGLVDDDVTEPGDDRDHANATLERIAADLRTIADALVG